VTVDFERGYGLAPAELAAALLEVGAAGCNLEDTDHATRTQVAPEAQAELIAAVRAAAPELVLNARVDTFILALDTPQETLVEAALARARVYIEAGADCVYPILLRERAATAAFVAGVGAPVNVYAALPLGELAELGVARVSYGPQLYRAAQQQLSDALAKIAR
jgi:2-methylisocitrate lyase-like PEP mutase family enzyme